jgi:hypothetical protein
MKFEFGVAARYRGSGDIEDLYPSRFADYDSAHEYAKTFEECFPTIFFIVDEKYVFRCKRCATLNQPYKIYKIECHPWGQVETCVWWSEFIKEPEKYLFFAEGIINNT